MYNSCAAAGSRGARAVPGAPTLRGASYLLEGEVPAAKVHELQQQLSAPTRGEGVLETALDRSSRSAARSRRGPGPSTTRWTARSTCSMCSGGSRVPALGSQP